MSAPSFTQLDAPVRTPSRAVVVAIAATALVLAAGVTWLLVGHRAEPVPAAPSTSSLQSRP
jgi:hypothetical protein